MLGWRVQRAHLLQHNEVVIEKNSPIQELFKFGPLKNYWEVWNKEVQKWRNSGWKRSSYQLLDPLSRRQHQRKIARQYFQCWVSLKVECRVINDQIKSNKRRRWICLLFTVQFTLKIVWRLLVWDYEEKFSQRGRDRAWRSEKASIVDDEAEWLQDYQKAWIRSIRPGISCRGLSWKQIRSQMHLKSQDNLELNGIVYPTGKRDFLKLVKSIHRFLLSYVQR